MVFKALADANVKEVMKPNGEMLHVHHLYEHDKDAADPGAQAFLVAMPPNNTGRAHFHASDQFQIFFSDEEGSVFQRTPMEGVFVHYADAYTVYGPFSSGPGGLEFFTLRAHGSDVTAYMPESREELGDRKPGRRDHANVSPDPSKLEAGSSETVTLIEPTADGMAAYLLKVGAGGKITVPSAESSSGQYLCVVGGEVVEDGRTFGRKSLGFVQPDDPAPELQAGDSGGFEVVVLNYPQPTHPLAIADRT